MKFHSKWFVPICPILFGLSIYAAQPDTQNPGAEMLMLKWQDSRLTNFFGRDLQGAKLTRNSSGTTLYFCNDSNIHAFTTNGFAESVKINTN